MRLVKLLITVLVLSSVFFYLKHHSNEQDHWVVVKNKSGLLLQFPTKPSFKSQQRQLSKLGQVKVTSYQVRQDNELFALLVMQPQSGKTQLTTLATLMKTIHELNDTLGMRYQHKQSLNYQGYEAYQYLATNEQDISVWCRTIAKGNALLSLIYGNNIDSVNLTRRDQFFDSLQM